MWGVELMHNTIKFLKIIVDMLYEDYNLKLEILEELKKDMERDSEWLRK